MKTIRLKDRGILPDTDITLSLYKLFLENPTDTEFVFEDADYYFSPFDEMKADYRISNSDPMPYRVSAVWMKNMKNCVLRGNGARLFCSGQMQVFTLDRCENIQLQGFTVNWKKPLVAEGRVVGKDDSGVDIYIDPALFPHRYINGELEFDVGADEWYALERRFIVFEPYNYTVRRDTGDIFFTHTEEKGENIYRFDANAPWKIEVGDLVNLRHNFRIHAGVFSERCRDLTVENITFHSCGGLGCLAQFCHNLTYRAVNFLPDRASGRFVSSGRDDGMHITCNSGTVTITECSFHALMDDPINVHGCCVTSDEAVDSRTLRCKYRHRQAQGFLYWAEKGDEIVFIERGAMTPIVTAQVESYTLEESDTFLLRFAKPLPEEIIAAANKGDAIALDNLTHTAEFICTHNRFGSCRARGVLISTPKRVVVSDNLFESSGAAILVAGDSNYWFESGECHDVTIARNVFTNACMTSFYEFCNGIISVCPVVPKPELNKPYHKNIKITENVFDVGQQAALYAFSTDSLEFENNKIFATEPQSERGRIDLSFCKNVTIKDNFFTCPDRPSVSAENCGEIKSDI